MQMEVGVRLVDKERRVGDVAETARGHGCSAAIVEGTIEIVCAGVVVDDAVVQGAISRAAEVLRTVSDKRAIVQRGILRSAAPIDGRVAVQNAAVQSATICPAPVKGGR